MIAEVYWFTDNDMVTVFDEHGHQMPDYSGHHFAVAGHVLRDAPLTAKFYRADLAVGSKERITRKDFTER